MTRRLLLFVGVFGYLLAGTCEAKKLLSFNGEVYFPEEKIQLVLEFTDGGQISSEILPAPGNNYKIKAKLKHLKALALDLSTELESAVEKVLADKGKSQAIRGTFASQYSLLNYKPTYELSGQFEISNGRLIFNNLSWGGLRAEGFINLLAPNEVSLSVFMDDVMTKDVLFLVGYKDEQAQITGLMSGGIKLSGFLDRLFIKGNLKATDGFIQDLQYAIFNLNFEGVYPTVYINNSNIIQTDGISFNLEGNFDLPKGQASLKDGLLALEKTPMIDEHGSSREWTIKRKQEAGDKAVTEFKYRVQDPAQEKTFGKDSDMLGVERSIKF